MRILVTNDDGIQSEGVKTLAELLSEKGHKVTVVAPDGNRSAFSHSLSIYKKLTFLRQNISENFVDCFGVFLKIEVFIRNV